jgi:hypothetical protein
MMTVQPFNDICSNAPNLFLRQPFLIMFQQTAHDASCWAVSANIA